MIKIDTKSASHPLHYPPGYFPFIFCFSPYLLDISPIMSNRDSSRSYIHLTASHHVLYLEEWVHEKLPFDDIDVNLNQDSDDEEYLTGNFGHSQPQHPSNGTFGASRTYARPVPPAWKDLSLSEFLADHENFPRDGTILKRINREDFLEAREDKTMDEHDISAISTSSLGQNVLDAFTSEGLSQNLDGLDNSPNLRPHARSSVSPAGTMNTPEMNRVRRSYETPVARIMR
ncbi:hypothetical protein BABINDRAFT_169103 [Babjeviella inositovora NRRL Y-12698]|uniref:Uncharacterized protein n=1 Tax=Babjeviella inositovora NRRL Y-12698 TaxID=984486 RepID=A0A1E3QIH1_9ASCO|nr:uncharacterized protein BABINDRAFT_169103 [Babjeviella inositovora NRRL Y-12698]ODQ77495.1 hypothetical protein BABINDRAFT_169103 [Babjeviella inositovora NRRL Y-12698]